MIDSTPSKAVRDFTVIVLVLAGISGVLMWWLGDATSIAHNPNALPTGASAPAIQAAGWVNGPAPQPGDFAGKVVVIEAWATWCGPCRQRAPELAKIAEKYRARPVVFVGLTTDDAQMLPKIQQFLDEAGITFLNGYGAFDTLTALGAEYIPSAWVIGSQGKIVWNDNSPDDLESGIETALAQMSAGSTR